MTVKIYFGLYAMLSLSLWAESALPGVRPFTQKTSYPALYEILRGERFYSENQFTFGFSRNIIGVENPLKMKSLGFQKGSSFLQVHPLISFEKRYNYEYDNEVSAWDGGLWVLGSKEGLNFYLDARIFTEFHSSFQPQSYDMEFVEVQVEDEWGANNSYVSYARYRASFDYTGSLGTVGYRRGALNWGPGRYYSLMFSNYAVPFSSLYYYVSLGPIRVTSLWGRLGIQGDKTFGHSEKTRSVYAHRYEWQINDYLLVAINEQLITFEQEVYSALIPVVPLFMEKGLGLEDNNNGSISMDLSARFLNNYLVYSEFLVDDIQDPTGLFNNHYGNRWAFLSGVEYRRRNTSTEVALGVEYARVEPWVYTHKEPRTAQATHRGVPLGASIGPNSQALSVYINYYADIKRYLGLRFETLWKGDDFGSDAENAAIYKDNTVKYFLSGDVKPIFRLLPELSWEVMGLQVIFNSNLIASRDFQVKFLYDY